MTPATHAVTAPTGDRVHPPTGLDRAPRAPARAARSFPLTVIAAFVVSRTIAIGATFAFGTGAFTDRFSGLVSWDAGWYRRIAEHGYGPAPHGGQQTPWPFFPLYPALVRAVHTVGISYDLAMVLISDAVFLVGLLGLYRLAERHCGHGAASWAVWACALFPLSIVFSMGYASSLVLASTTWAFSWLEDHRDGLAALALAVAVAARPNGFLIAAVAGFSVAFYGWRAQRDRSARPSIDRPTARRLLVVMGPAAGVFLAWCALCWYWTSDPLVFFTAKSAWHESTVADVLHPENAAVPHLTVMAVALVPVVLFARRWRPDWALLTAVLILPSLALGIVGMGRYVNECFGVFVASGWLLGRLPRAVSAVIVAGSAIAMVLFTNLMIRHQYLP